MPERNTPAGDGPGDSTRLPEPGEWVAIEQGCTCTVRDGERPDNVRWGEMWLVRGCPLHDPGLTGGSPADRTG